MESCSLWTASRYPFRLPDSWEQRLIQALKSELKRMVAGKGGLTILPFWPFHEARQLGQKPLPPKA